MGQTGSMDGPQNVLALPQAPDAMELRHLRAFVAVADDLSFSRAAQRLFISQPALSRQIRGLERLVGCDLFRRSTQRVELTLAGEALLARARALLADLDDAISVTRSVGGELAGHPADDPLLSPLQTSLAGLPPLLIQAASGDAVLQEAQLLARHATQCGVDASITVYPVPTHDFHIFWSFLPEARDAIDQLGRFVRTVASTPGESAAPQPG
jgi:DNA-binding transcriptional LysR family regulator